MVRDRKEKKRNRLSKGIMEFINIGENIGEAIGGLAGTATKTSSARLEPGSTYCV